MIEQALVNVLGFAATTGVAFKMGRDWDEYREVLARRHARAQERKLNKKRDSMKTATGYIHSKTRVPTNPGFTYNIYTDVDKEFNFTPGQPITLVDVHPDDLLRRSSAQPLRLLVAAGLNATHVGKRISVMTANGPLVEDTLTHLHTRWADGKGITCIAFENVRPNPSQYDPFFDVAPDAPVAVIEETK